MNRWLLLCPALLLGQGCFSFDPCDFGSAPRFFVEGRYVEQLRFPAGGSVEFSLAAESYSSSGPFSVEERTSRGQNFVVISSAVPGQGSIEARDECDRTSRLEIEAVPVGGTSVETSLDDSPEMLPAADHVNGEAILVGTEFTARVRWLDEEGRQLAGSVVAKWPTVTGGISVTGSRNDYSVKVVGPAGPASIRFPWGEPLDLEVAAKGSARRIEIWELDESSTWNDWLHGVRLGGPFEVALGTLPALTFHAFDEGDRLLLGNVVAVVSNETEIAELVPYKALLVVDPRSPGTSRIEIETDGARTSFDLNVAD